MDRESPTLFTILTTTTTTPNNSIIVNTVKITTMSTFVSTDKVLPTAPIFLATIFGAIAAFIGNYLRFFVTEVNERVELLMYVALVNTVVAWVEPVFASAWAFWPTAISLFLSVVAMVIWEKHNGFYAPLYRHRGFYVQAWIFYVPYRSASFRSLLLYSAAVFAFLVLVASALAYVLATFAEIYERFRASTDVDEEFSHLPGFWTTVGWRVRIMEERVLAYRYGGDVSWWTAIGNMEYAHVAAITSSETARCAWFDALVARTLSLVDVNPAGNYIWSSVPNPITGVQTSVIFFPRRSFFVRNRKNIWVSLANATALAKSAVRTSVAGVNDVSRAIETVRVVIVSGLVALARVLAIAIGQLVVVAAHAASPVISQVLCPRQVAIKAWYNGTVQSLGNWKDVKCQRLDALFQQAMNKVNDVVSALFNPVFAMVALIWTTPRDLVGAGWAWVSVSAIAVFEELCNRKDALKASVTAAFRTGSRRAGRRTSALFLAIFRPVIVLVTLPIRIALHLAIGAGTLGAECFGPFASGFTQVYDQALMLPEYVQTVIELAPLAREASVIMAQAATDLTRALYQGLFVQTPLGALLFVVVFARVLAGPTLVGFILLPTLGALTRRGNNARRA